MSSFLNKNAPFASGFLWTWGYLVHFAGPAGFGESAPLVWMGFSDNVFLVATLCSYLLAVVLFRNSPEKVLPRLSTFGCVSMSCGSVVILFLGLNSLENTFITVLSSVFAGIGIALCSIAWGSALSRVDMESLEKTVLGWLPMFSIVFLLIAASTLGLYIVNVVLSVLLVGLPVASHVGFISTSQNSTRISLPCANNAPGDDLAKVKVLFAKTLFYLLLVFCSLSFIWLAFTSQRAFSFGLSMLAFSAGVILLFVITWVSLNKTKRFGLLTLYRWALPVTVLSLGLSIFHCEGSTVLSYILFVAVYIGFDVTAKLLFIYIAQSHRPHAVSIIGLGLSVINLGGIIGASVWNQVSVFFQSIDFATAMLLALFPLVLSMTLSMGQDILLLKTPSHPIGSSIVGINSSEGGNELQKKCQSVGAEYGLTPRELEVITLLAQGRSRTYIREVLFISKGTVDTHAYHAYAKLGIKSKDELMHLLLD